MVTLGHLPGGSDRTVAWGVSSDGNVVVGGASSAASQAGDEAFRWTAGGGIVGLGSLPADGSFWSRAQAASGDGSVVVGLSLGDADGTGGFNNAAFIWTQATGMKRLIDVLVANGATGLDGWILTDATAISADGKWVVGSGRPPGEFRTEPFLAFVGNVDGSVDISGTIKSAEGQDICAMVLASGQFMFSCNPAGVLSLSGLPRENDGTVKRQIYADGFFPKIDILRDSVEEAVVMTRSGTCPNYNTLYDPAFVPDSAGKRIDISGQVTLQNSQTPICAMALANGQYMFTCDGTGNYALNIPLDTNGQFKLQVYADGFAPITQKFDEFSTNNDVRMARAVECQ
jgi:probable HAF family extracellular repeat protein